MIAYYYTLRFKKNKYESQSPSLSRYHHRHAVILSISDNTISRGITIDDKLIYITDLGIFVPFVEYTYYIIYLKSNPVRLFYGL
jgi:hypothetical protein